MMTFVSNCHTAHGIMKLVSVQMTEWLCCLQPCRTLCKSQNPAVNGLKHIQLCGACVDRKIKNAAYSNQAMQLSILAIVL